MARRLAVGLGPFLRLTSLYRRRPSFLDGYREDAFRMLTRAMAHTGVRHDSTVTVIGGELMPPGGAIILTGHFLLNGVLGRWLYDRGDRWCVLEAFDTERRRYLGLPVPYESIPGGAASLVKVRARVRAGLKVLALVDSGLGTAGRVQVDTVAGVRYISPAAIELSVKLRIPIVFAVTRFDEAGNVVLTIQRPSRDETAVIVTEFCDFYRDQAAAMRR